MDGFGLDDPNSGEERSRRAMLDVWNRTLGQIPTQFGKLVHMAGLLNENSGRYQHFGIAQLYGEDEADRVLRSSHERVFAEWLTNSLERQRNEIERYLDGVPDDRAVVIDTWSNLRPYEKLPPETAGKAERLLFKSDLEIILELIRRETSGSA